jgi:signal-transduction protein with cAMP-binding, CBS, and nucleotidyltransferase domain
MSSLKTRGDAPYEYSQTCESASFYGAAVGHGHGRREENDVGAVVVLDNGQLQGMFSERDVMLRIVLEKRDPEKIEVKDVMTTDVVAIRKDAKPEEAVQLMWERHIRHLPVVREDGKVEGIVEIRNLFHERFEDMTQQLDSLESYIAMDGIGG